MIIRASDQPRGIALIIVMIAVMILTVLAAGFAYSMKVEVRLAMNSRNHAELEWMGRSGMEYAKWVLAEDMKLGPKDSGDDVWAGGMGGVAASNSPLAMVRLPTTLELGRGRVTINPMVDMERKININAADRPLLERALIRMGADAGTIPTVVASILDWIDPDDRENLQGAESDYYEGLDFPYLAKNGPMDDLNELLFVQGVTPEMFRGGGPVFSAGDGRRSAFDDDFPNYEFGLKDVFTALGSGRINQLTADQRTLEIVLGDEVLASQFIQFRSGPDAVDGTEDDVPVDLSFIIPDPVAQAQAQALLQDMRSSTFEVRVDAEIANSRRSFIGVLVRMNPNDIQLVSFRALDETAPKQAAP